MKRSIIQIHEELCNGCGECIDACHEGAIELIDGKAVLVSDMYCDGLGACLPNCPTGAIEMIEREAVEFDESAVEMRRQDIMDRSHHRMGGCPGSMTAIIERTLKTTEPTHPELQALPSNAQDRKPLSELQQWPVQLSLVNPAAPFFQDANLLVAADCTAFAYADFHRDFIKNHITVIGCPKLDDNAYYAEKLTEIMKLNTIHSITVVRMVVPCCGGIIQAVKQAMLNSRTIVPYREVTVGIDGQLVN